MLLTVCVFRWHSLRMLGDNTRAVKVSCILLSKRQYVPKNTAQRDFFSKLYHWCTLRNCYECLTNCVSDRYYSESIFVPTQFQVQMLNPEATYLKYTGWHKKKRELLKCILAAMYSWQHCGTGTMSYRQPRHGSVERSTACFRHKNVLQKEW